MIRTIMSSLCATLLTGIVFAQTPPLKPDVPAIPAPKPMQLQTAAAKSRILSIDEAVRLALELQTSPRIAGNDLSAAVAKERQAVTELLPHFSLGANATDLSVIRRGNFTGGSTGWTTQGSVNANLLLFDFGRTRDLVGEQRFLVDAARFVLAQSKTDVEQAVRNAYHALEQSKALMIASEANLTNRRAQFALAEARLNTGVGAPSDFVQAQTTVADATISVISSRASVLNSQISLADAVGLDSRTEIIIATASENAPAKSLDDWASEALTKRYEVREGQSRLESKRAAVAAARKSNLPSVSLAAGISTRGVSDPLNSQTGSVGLIASWPIFDGGLGRARADEVAANARTAEVQLVQTKRQVVSEVTTAYVAFISATQRSEVAVIQLANARELVRIAEGRYRGGIGNFLDVTSAQDNLYNADRNLAQANGDLQRSEVALRKAAGVSAIAPVPTLDERGKTN